MKMKTLVLSFALAVAACSSLPRKEVAVRANATAGQTVWSIQDTERRLCNQVAFDANPTEPITECTGPLATAAQLTTEKHRAFAKHLSAVYAVRIRVDQALLTWQPGQPEPSGLNSMLTEAQAALALVRGLATTNEQRELVDAGVTLVAEIKKIIDAVRS